MYRGAKPIHRLSCLLLTLILLSSACQVRAQATDLVDLGRQLLRLIDTVSVRGLDTAYVSIPRKPWQFIVKSNLSQSQLRLQSTIDAATAFNDVEGKADWEARVLTPTSMNVGLWAGYRGYGLGYTMNVNHDKNYLLTLAVTGGAYGLNFRMHRFREAHSEVVIEANDHQELRQDMDFYEPIHSRTLVIDGYYALNGKRFSYCAAYDQSTIQLRSAGSLLVGGMYYYSHTNYDHDKNAYFVLMMHDIGRIKQWQACAGVGYAYNFVPAKGLLVSALAMPMVSVLNRIRISRYGSNLHDYVYSPADHEQPSPSDYHIWPMEEDSENGRVTFNIDARVSLTYQWNSYFLNIYTQYYNFRYKRADNGGSHTDWSVNASIGIRL